MNADGYRSYADPSTVLAEGVHQFIQGAIFGSIWSMVTPFPAPGSSAALAGTSSVVRLLDAKRFSHVSPILNHLMPEATSGVFRPAPPFSAISTLPSKAIAFGTVLCVARISSGSLMLVRRRDDLWNHGFGCFVAYRYYSHFLATSEIRLIRHNRIVGAGVLAAVFYANFLV